MKHCLAVCMLLIVGSVLTFAALVSASSPPAADGSAIQLVEALGCRGCHRIQEYGGSSATDLTDVGTRLTPAEIAQSLAPHPGSDASLSMLTYTTLSAEEIDKLSNYLYNLR